MIRSALLALGLFLVMTGTFLFCIKQSLLRYCPQWLLENKVSGYFVQELEGERLLIVPQWIAILILTLGTSLYLYTLGTKRNPVQTNSEIEPE